MTELPLAVNLQGDYGFKVVVVDEEDTIAEVIQKAADQIAGVLVPPFPSGTVLKARIHGAEDPLSDDVSVKQAKLKQMEALVIFAEN